ncbi:MAG: hydroxyacid dehydrogenase [Ruminococcaceae bacterium]|nr:hydroxyacid dehydrogenase [Oscillospiraceae bacterium]
MKLVILDRITLGEDLCMARAEDFGTVISFDQTAPAEVESHVGDADVVLVNKVKLGAHNLHQAKNLKLILEAATGYDNIDLAYCRERGIAVCNVPGYSVYSVAQVTVSMVLSLVNHLKTYTRYTSDGTYSKGESANILTPVYHELLGKTWGIVGYGGIGSRVGAIAEALGCRVLAYKRTPIEGVTCTDIDTLCKESDIISVHIPLSDETRGLISRERIESMKPGAIFVNTARGAVADEAALCEAVLNSRLGGLGLDVYAVEPFSTESPFYAVKELDNVCLTPHMAWGAIEARERCFNEMILNMEAFLAGTIRNRVDLTK